MILVDHLLSLSVAIDTRSTCPVSPVHRDQTNTRFAGPIFSKRSAATCRAGTLPSSLG